MLIKTTLSHTGEYSLVRAARFLEEWPPSALQTEQTPRLNWAFHMEGSWDLVNVVVSQSGPNVAATVETGGATSDAVSQVSRILGLDVDATDFTAGAMADPVAASLIAERPGLRPSTFWSTYEAAVWAVLSQRVSMMQASRLKLNMARELGVECHGFSVFPPPSTLAELAEFPGVNAAKIDRLRAVGDAALDGLLDGAALRSTTKADAIDRLQKIPGIGPFSAELILVRGAGHPDVFPRAEQRLHRIMRDCYDRPNADPAELSTIADQWRPYRSWVSFLLRSSANHESA